MSGTVCTRLVLASTLTLLLGAGARHAAAHQVPPGCSGSGVELKLYVFRADGRTRAVGDANECEELVYRGRLCHVGDNVCDLEGGNLTLVTADGNRYGVTPPGGVPPLANGTCIDTQAVTYRTRRADAFAGSASANLYYNGGTVHSGPGTTDSTANAAVGTAIAVRFCDDRNICNGMETCDPYASDGVRTGLCRAGTPLVCDDGNVCNGLETCNPAFGCVGGTPLVCDDHDPCTANRCDPVAGCVFPPVRQPLAAASRAYGVALDVAASHVVPPAPDSRVMNPGGESASLPGGLGEIELLRVEESSSRDGSRQAASAAATTAAVRLLPDGRGGFLVTATSIRASASCSADRSSASCTSQGSELEDVTVAGRNLGTVSEPTTITFVDPLFRLVTVDLLEKIPHGASAGRVQPEDGGFASGLAVNAIHVTIGPSALDLVVAHAEASASYGVDVCPAVPRVSGRGFVLRAGSDATEIGRVDLPSTGGSEDATLLHVGPASAASASAESNAGFSHTEGRVDAVADEAASATETEIERLRLDAPPVSADAVRAQCRSTASRSGASSSGSATIARLSIAGTDVCAALGLDARCNPPPNTVLELGSALRVVLNEQLLDSRDPRSTAITVNAVHVTGNTFGSGFDVVVSSAHCDAHAVP